MKFYFRNGVKNSTYAYSICKSEYVRKISLYASMVAQRLCGNLELGEYLRWNDPNVSLRAKCAFHNELKASDVSTLLRTQTPVGF